MNSEKFPNSLDPGGILLAVFPIPKFIAFPNTIVPLHIFEPRYREMIEDILATDEKTFVLTNLEEKSNQPLKIGTFSKIISQEKYPDGRSNIIVECQEKVRIKDYFRPYSIDDYAIGEIEFISESESSNTPDSNMIMVNELIDAFTAHFESTTGKTIANFELELEKLPPGRIINTLCQLANIPIKKKILLFKENDLNQRSKKFIEILNEEMK